MKFSEVTYGELSSLTHEVLLSTHVRRYGLPLVKVIRYRGVYRAGTPGRPDALYIRATSQAAHEAWYSLANILDFSELEYVWGDNMAWAFSLGWNGYKVEQHPLAVVVGGRCREALESLLRDEYDLFCRDTMAQAIVLARQKIELTRERGEREKAERRRQNLLSQSNADANL